MTTGVKKSLPEPPQAHIAKRWTLRSLCSVSAAHTEAADTERGRHVKTGVNECLLFCVFTKEGHK